MNALVTIKNTAPNFDKNIDIIVEDRLIFMNQLGNNIYLSNNIKNGLYVKEEQAKPQTH